MPFWRPICVPARHNKLFMSNLDHNTLYDIVREDENW